MCDEQKKKQDQELVYNYRDWENFCKYLSNENRYILNDEYKKLTEEILKLAEDREAFLEQGSMFWRARTSKIPRVTEDGAIDSDSYTAEEMSACQEEDTKDGRANPTGISYLYLAENIETAIAEIRPYIGDKITAASFVLSRKIKIVDIRQGAPSLPEAVFSKNKDSFDNLWFGIKMYFSMPVKPQDPKGYIPMQYVAELFKNNGFDGIKFDSVQREGNFNLVLFNPSDVRLNNMVERHIKKIEYYDHLRFLNECLEKQK
ncbi:MAG: RES family NAD+ phosphorylase [Candidatus Omnitrophica bacterium]|nr:RES family NAD+ phosphorylase [Candidatus Omnitrophota bacterium]